MEQRIWCVVFQAEGFPLLSYLVQSPDEASAKIITERKALATIDTKRVDVLLARKISTDSIVQTADGGHISLWGAPGFKAK